MQYVLNCQLLSFIASEPRVKLPALYGNQPTHSSTAPLAQWRKSLKPKMPLLGLCWMVAVMEEHFIMPSPKMRS